MDGRKWSQEVCQQANYGPAVRSGGVVKPVAKPKGLVSLGKAPASSTVSARKGAAWNQLEEEAKKREEESAKKQDDSRPDWLALNPSLLFTGPLCKGVLDALHLARLEVKT